MVRDGVVDIVVRLRDCGFDPRRVGEDGSESRCPGHRSFDHSLSITRNEFSHAVLECRASQNCHQTNFSDRTQRVLAAQVRGEYHMINTNRTRRPVMAVAKVFRTGRSQAIRLPTEFRVEADTVHLKRTGEGFLVITREPWEVFFEGVEQLSDQFCEKCSITTARPAPRITGASATIWSKRAR